MRIYAGIDEAGYGPMFGPFTIACTVFRIDEPAPEHTAPDTPPPDLWAMLHTAVCRSLKDRKRRVAVNDSKKVYTKASGLTHLERGVLAFGALLGHRPNSLDAYLRAIAHDAESYSTTLPWYNGAEPATDPFPTTLTPEALGITAATLKRSCAKANVQLNHMSCAVLYEDRFNRIVAQTRSKARCNWTFVSQHLWNLWQQHGQSHPWVVIDRQGGRTHYHHPLSLIFEGASIRETEHNDACSRYVVTDRDRSMTLSFETRSDANHLPNALASMLAKYTREMLMGRFNAYFQNHVPGLAPTAGYVQDGRRFLGEIETTLETLGVDRSRLIRSR
ncbi:MAG: hypothetical protein ACYTGQ_04915 [Planctomycetota bacterium]|jgi:hypothetical protein